MPLIQHSHQILLPKVFLGLSDAIIHLYIFYIYVQEGSKMATFHGEIGNYSRRYDWEDVFGRLNS